MAEVTTKIKQYGPHDSFKYVQTSKGTFWVNDENVREGDEVVVNCDDGSFYAFVVKVVSRG